MVRIRRSEEKEGGWEKSEDEALTMAVDVDWALPCVN